jgi:DNA-binding IscR family transcriptional regulator
VPGGGLLKNPPKTITVSEAVKMIEAVLPSTMVQRSWSLGPQRMCQELRRVVQQLEQRSGDS